MAGGTFEEYFGSRKWRVATEVTAVVPEAGDDAVVTTFTGGKFEIAGGKFHSPLSTARGRKGVLLQEVGADGSDVAGSRIAVGVVVYDRARKEGAVR